MVVVAGARLVSISRGDTIVLSCSCSCIFPHVWGFGAHMSARGVDSISSNPIHRLISARSRCIQNFKH